MTEKPIGRSGLLAGGNLVQWIPFLITFGFIFIYHVSPLGLSDYWWHLNTGRWIWNHGELPTDDPFLYSSPMPLDARASLILRGYPLSQLLFYGVYNLGGFYGLALLKGLLLTLFYGLLWNQLRRNRLQPVLALALVGLLPLLFFRFDELRPQLFSFIGTVLVLQLTERFLASGKQGKQLKWSALAALPLIMLLWANLHRGYIIGIGILLIFLMDEFIARKRGNAILPEGAFRRFLITVLLSLAFSFLNPGGVTAMWASFAEISGPFSKTVDEFLGPLQYFEILGAKHIGYLILAAAIIPCLALLPKMRRLSLAHILLLAAFLFAGMESFRFSLMMVAIVLAICSLYLAPAVNRWLSMGKRVPIFLVWCLATGFLANSALSRTSIASAPLDGVVPVAAVDYLARSDFSGNIYNRFEYGAYLSWRLYPRKVFIDSRNLSWDTFDEYMKAQALRGDYSGIFQKYQVGTVFYPVADRRFTNGISQLVASLINSPQWEVAYYDGLCIILARKDINGQIRVLDKQAVVADILRHARH